MLVEHRVGAEYRLRRCTLLGYQVVRPVTNGGDALVSGVTVLQAGIILINFGLLSSLCITD